MRRKIELRTCVPVCAAYIDDRDHIATLPEAAIEQLKRPDACGKSEATCSAVEEARCELMIGYTGVGAPLREEFRSGAVSAGEASTRVEPELLEPYTKQHRDVGAWAQQNKLDANELLARGGEVFIACNDGLLAYAGDPQGPLRELAASPGDHATYAQRLEAARESASQ